MQKRDFRKYLIALAITVAIFATALTLSSWINRNKIDELRSIQDSISINILSSETQFNLLKDAACDDLISSAIGQELGSLADRLSFLESTGKKDDQELKTLKRYYSLLEIKDYLLISSTANKCPKRPVTILYFYEDKCPDCLRQGEVLTYIRQHNPDDIRIYSFDYNIDVSAIKTLANIHKVKTPLPAIVINGKAYSGFKTVEELTKIVPAMAFEKQASTTQATTTKSTK